MSDLFNDPTPPKKPARGKTKTPAEEIAAADQAATVEESVGALVTQTVENPVAVFTDEAKFSEFYTKLKAETEKHTPDLSTDKGRKAVASLAFRVTKAKTTLVAAGKGLTEEWRRQTALVNASRNKMETELDALAAEVRKPLTDWEQAEATRVAANAAVIVQLRADAIVKEDDTSETVEARGRTIHEMTFDEPQWTPDEAEQAKAEKTQAIHLLLTARNRLRREEEDRAELAKLRAEAAERAEKERIEAEARAEQEAAEAAERERVAAAEQAEKEAREAAEREAARIEEARLAAVEAARVEAERVAAEEAAERERQHQAALAAEQERAAAAEREAEQRAEAARIEAQAAIEAANERAAKAERERVEEAERVAAEAAERARADAAEKEAAAARARDQEHRTTVKTAVKEALIEHCGLDEEAARKVVTAIVAGDVPHTTVAF